MKIVAGLGNPGASFAGTRHNAGFAVLDRVAAREGAVFGTSRFMGQAALASIGGERVLLLKPGTMMNLSGLSVAGAAGFYKVGPEGVLVVVDDMDLPLGRLRARPGGSSAGHKGLDSVIAGMGTEDVPRLKVGIGRDPLVEGRSHVLGKFTPAEAAIADSAFGRACEAVVVWVASGMDECMNRFNAAAGVEGG